MTTTETRSTEGHAGKILAALMVVYVVWGSVYVAVRVVVEEAPPLASIGIRYVVASIVLALVAASRGGVRVLALNRRTALSCLLLAVLLPTLANGLVSFAESRGVAAGPAALLSAMAPMSIAALRMLAHDRPRPSTLTGVLVGFLGLAVLILLGRPSDGFPLWPSLIVVFSANCWAVGSFLQSRLTLPSSILVVAFYETLFGGLILTGAGLTAGERISTGYSAQTWGALAYLTLSSTVAFTSYTWLLSNAPISLVATHAYVNPVVAVFLGWVLLSEALTPAVVIGGAIVVAAVTVVVTAERPRSQRPGDDAPSQSQASGVHRRCDQ